MIPLVSQAAIINCGIGFPGQMGLIVGSDGSKDEFLGIPGGSMGDLRMKLPELGMRNNLNWACGPDSVRIRSDMSGGPDPGNFAFVEADFLFDVVDKPVPYTLSASSSAIEVRFRQFHPIFGSICLSPGCDSDHIDAGFSSGILMPGFTYGLQFHPPVDGDFKFKLQVPEPGSLTLLAIALIGLIGTGFSRRKDVLV